MKKLQLTQAQVFQFYIGSCKLLIENDKAEEGYRIFDFTGLKKVSRPVENLEWLALSGDLVFNIKECKLLLTPIRKLPLDKICELCRLVDPEVFGNFYWTKWKLAENPEYPNFLSLIHSKVDVYFDIDTETGEVELIQKHESGLIKNDSWADEDHQKNCTYFQWYFTNGVLCSLMPEKDNALEMGYALDATEILKQNVEMV